MNLLPCEAGSLVYDIGSSTIQFGFAGDAQPLFSVPASASQRPKDGELTPEFGHSWLQKRIPGIEVMPMISDSGSLADTDILSSFFDWTYQACLSVENPTERPVLVTQPSHLCLRDEQAFQSWRLSLCESLFDFAGHPAVCLEHDSVLACFPHATHTALVIDFGWSCVRTLPILEGRPLLGSMAINDIGGHKLCDVLEARLSANAKVAPLIEFLDASHLSKSQHRYCVRAVVQDIIQSCLTFDLKVFIELNNPIFGIRFRGIA
jgi:actin beta/gamma 1